MVTWLRNPSAAKIFVINEISFSLPKKMPYLNEFFLLKLHKMRISPKNLYWYWFVLANLCVNLCEGINCYKSLPKHKTIIEDPDNIIQDFKTVRLGFTL